MTEEAVEHAEAKQKNVLVLKLRGTKKPSISWAANTIDNEDMGKKSSKRKIRQATMIPSVWLI